MSPYLGSTLDQLRVRFRPCPQTNRLTSASESHLEAPTKSPGFGALGMNGLHIVARRTSSRCSRRFLSCFLLDAYGLEQRDQPHPTVEVAAVAMAIYEAAADQVSAAFELDHHLNGTFAHVPIVPTRCADNIGARPQT